MAKKSCMGGACGTGGAKKPAAIPKKAGGTATGLKATTRGKKKA